MASSDIKLRLEYIVEIDGFEPYEEALEFPITEYKVGQPASVPGQIVLGLQVKESDYILHRLAGKMTLDFESEGVDPAVELLKIRWSDPSGQTDPVTACYALSLDQAVDEIPELSDDMEWKFLLKQEATEPPVYHLIYVVPEESAEGTGEVGFGREEECALLADWMCEPNSEEAPEKVRTKWKVLDCECG